ncbi:helix-hairpin-helix domain-containing protein [Geobacter anodireducens]
MTDIQKELQKIRGIGEVLAKRLAEAGHDTFEKIAAAGEEGLRAIKGMNPRSVAAIVAQAAELAKGRAEDRDRRVEELKAAALTCGIRWRESPARCGSALPMNWKRRRPAGWKRSSSRW